MRTLHSPTSISHLQTIFVTVKNNGSDLYFATYDGASYVILDVNALTNDISYIYAGTNPNNPKHVTWNQFNAAKSVVWNP